MFLLHENGLYRLTTIDEDKKPELKKVMDICPGQKIQALNDNLFYIITCDENKVRLVQRISLGFYLLFF